MLKIRKETSSGISMVLAVIALAVVAAIAVGAPFFMSALIDKDTMQLAPALIFVYTVLLPVVVADVMLIQLLRFVSKKQVFTAGAVAKLRGISWCCFAECAILIAYPLMVMGRYVFYRITAAFVAAFLGIVLRVVKNVLEEATALKSENDLTI